MKFSSECHPSDEELLCLNDHELPVRQIAAIRSHLGDCWVCRARAQEMESAVASFVASRRDFEANIIPPIEHSRALLKQRLEREARAAKYRVEWVQPLRRGWPILALGLAAIFLIANGAAISRRLRPRVPENKAASIDPLPRADLTPGATRPVLRSEICSMPHEEVVRAVSTPVRQQVFQEYGMAKASARDYEVDYLITPGLGGSDDIRNLWPEPYARTAWNAHAKDELEDRLHQMVCSGEIDLQTAQNAIASDWIVAYEKYVESAPLQPKGVGEPIAR